MFLQKVSNNLGADVRIREKEPSYHPYDRPAMIEKIDISEEEKNIKVITDKRYPGISYVRCTSSSPFQDQGRSFSVKHPDGSVGNVDVTFTSTCEMVVENHNHMALTAAKVNETLNLNLGIRILNPMNRKLRTFIRVIVKSVIPLAKVIGYLWKVIFLGVFLRIKNNDKDWRKRGGPRRVIFWIYGGAYLSGDIEGNLGIGMFCFFRDLLVTLVLECNLEFLLSFCS